MTQICVILAHIPLWHDFCVFMCDKSSKQKNKEEKNYDVST